MKILHSASTVLHHASEVVGGRMIDAYESPGRVTSIINALSPLYEILMVPTNLTLAEAAAEKVHTPAYLAHLKSIFSLWRKFDMVDSHGCILPECFPVNRLAGKKSREPKDPAARVGFYAFDMSTGISQDTYVSAIASADLARRGAEALASREDDVVFALCRPPGHHCCTDLMGGYCYLNNAAIAVRTLLERLQERGDDGQVSILDLDFHHGNGTQSIFYADQNPCYVSIHGEDEYPYFTGSPCETGEGAGEGYNLNLPIPCDEEAVDFSLYRPRLEEAVEMVRSVDTKYLVVSLGFDTFVGDPVGKFALQREDYGAIGETVGRLGVPTMLVLEGGYVVAELGRNCVSFLQGLERGRMGTKTNGVCTGLTNGVHHDLNSDSDEDLER